MSAVLGIIKAHNGSLQFTSHLGHGSTFKVYLPVQIGSSCGDDFLNNATSFDQWQGSGTLLLVEDEDQVRNFTKVFLQKLGFIVIDASNGREALELYQKNVAKVSIIITDLNMPVMDGYELCHELKKLNPELPIIVISGFGDTNITSRIDHYDKVSLIRKPYKFDQLRDELKSVVEGMEKKT